MIVVTVGTVVVIVVVTVEEVVMREETIDEMTEEIKIVVEMIDVKDDLISLEMMSRKFKKFIFLN